MHTEHKAESSLQSGHAKHQCTHHEAKVQTFSESHLPVTLFPYVQLNKTEIVRKFQINLTPRNENTRYKTY